MRFKLETFRSFMKKMSIGMKKNVQDFRTRWRKAKSKVQRYVADIDCTLPKQQEHKIKMSNSLNRRLRGKTIKIFGPPGTVTENLLKRVQRYLRQVILMKSVMYRLQTKLLMNVLQELEKDLKNTMKISSIFGHYILWPDNSLLRFPYQIQRLTC